MVGLLVNAFCKVDWLFEQGQKLLIGQWQDKGTLVWAQHKAFYDCTWPRFYEELTKITTTTTTAAALEAVTDLK